MKIDRGIREDLGEQEMPQPLRYGKDSAGNWYCCPPGFTTGYASLSRHEVVEHDDGTITVTPSIEVKNHLQYWHGFLEQGIWREC